MCQVAPLLQDGLRRFADHPLVGEVRGIGLIGAVEFVADKASKAPFDPPGRVGSAFDGFARKHGLILRSIGDTLAFSPPLIISAEEIESMLERFGKALDDTWAWLNEGGLSRVA